MTQRWGLGEGDREVSLEEGHPKVGLGGEHRSEPGVGRPRGGSGRGGLGPWQSRLQALPTTLLQQRHREGGNSKGSQGSGGSEGRKTQGSWLPGTLRVSGILFSILRFS